MTPLTKKAAVAKLRKLDSGAVSDALDSLALEGYVSGITRFSTNKTVAGAVLPVQLVPAGEATSKSHLGTAAIDAAGDNDVIIMANEGRIAMGGWGGVLSAGAKRNNVAGVIVDGASRDIDEAIELDFPVFSRGVTPVTARGRVSEQATNVPVTVSGVHVNPGDYVIADGAGVVFIPGSKIAEVLEAAERIVNKELAMIDQVATGLPMEKVMDHNYDTLLKGQAQ